MAEAQTEAAPEAGEGGFGVGVGLDVVAGVGVALVGVAEVGVAEVGVALVGVAEVGAADVSEVVGVPVVGAGGVGVGAGMHPISRKTLLTFVHCEKSVVFRTVPVQSLLV